MRWLHGIGCVFIIFIVCLLFHFYLFFSIFAYFLHYHSFLQKKIMTAKLFAQIHNCNLAKSVHNKWPQASGKKDGNLYVASLDDYIRDFLQVMAYHQFLKGGIGSDGPNK